MTEIPPVTSTDSGATLKRLREAKGLTQAQMAAKLGKSRTAVSAWEYGRKMSGKSRAAVAKLLGVTVDTLGAPWDPRAVRPQTRRQARNIAAYLDTLRDLGKSPNVSGVDPDDADHVSSRSLSTGAANMIDVPDQDLFDKMQWLWRLMDDRDTRAALVQTAWSLASPTMERTARGKAQG